MAKRTKKIKKDLDTAKKLVKKKRDLLEKLKNDIGQIMTAGGAIYGE